MYSEIALWQEVFVCLFALLQLFTALNQFWLPNQYIEDGWGRQGGAGGAVWQLAGPRSCLLPYGV